MGIIMDNWDNWDNDEAISTLSTLSTPNFWPLIRKNEYMFTDEEWVWGTTFSDKLEFDASHP